jgi:hypothetical protein
VYFRCWWYNWYTDTLFDHRLALFSHRKLKAVVQSSMNLVASSKNVAVGGTSDSIIQQSAIDARGKLLEFHKVLKEYRWHEARENLCKQLRDQLHQAKILETKLQRFSFFFFVLNVHTNIRYNMCFSYNIHTLCTKYAVLSTEHWTTRANC